jgi:hypothetical protein
LAYVYKICNDVNDLIYVGTTTRTLKIRFSEHIRDSRRHRCIKRPLYQAMSSIGCEHFFILPLEECLDSDRFQRESYWVKTLGTQSRGYNVTFGGAGRRTIDYKKIVKYISDTQYTKTHIAYLCNCCVDSIDLICDIYGLCVDWDSRDELTTFKQTQLLSPRKKCICQELGLEFDSILNAAKWCTKSGLSHSVKACVNHISQACTGKRKHTCGYTWSYLEFH